MLGNGVLMKEILKGGGKLFLKTIAINLMCFFIVVSFSVLSTAAFTKNIGYTAYGTTSDSSEPIKLYTYYFEDGEDTQKSDYEEEGYTVSTNSIRSVLSNSGKAFFLIISQVFAFLLLCGFIYPEIWHNGTTDSNLVKFKHKNEDKFKGFKIGAVAAVPNYLFLVFLVIANLGVFPSFPVALYKFLNSSVYSFIDVIVGSAVAVSEIAVWRLALLFLLPLIIPAVSGVSYLLGYKNISVGEKFVYKKNKAGELK